MDDLLDGEAETPKEKPPSKKKTVCPHGYISAAEAAKKWGVTQRFVSAAAEEGRIASARQIDGKWYIPERAENPKKSAKAMPGYISTAEAAKKWGITQRSVGVAAKAGRAPGAKQIDGLWHIPENLEAPSNEKTQRLAGHVSVAKIAEEWGVSQRAVHKAAKEGHISGAKQVNGIWHIPEHAVCPIKGRSRGRK